MYLHFLEIFEDFEPLMSFNERILIHGIKKSILNHGAQFAPWNLTLSLMSHVKVRSLTTYHILLAEFGERPIQLYALKLTMGF